MTKPKERPILFSAPMIRALLAGHKTQTRRLITLPRWAEKSTLDLYDNDRAMAIARVSGCLAEVSCVQGQPGDRLWVRETWRIDDQIESKVVYRATEVAAVAFDWKPSIFLRRAHSRLLLEIKSERAERLQDISESDAKAEGSGYLLVEHPEWSGDHNRYRKAFRQLWDSIHVESDRWRANPLVRRVSFKVLADTLSSSQKLSEDV
jgi:hypothetical protein